MAKQKYYVVWNGRKKGIFQSWEECKIQVDQFPDAKYKSFNNFIEAELAFINNEGSQKSFQKPQFPTKNIHIGIAVDAACNAMTGVMEYQGIDLATKKRIFHQGPFEGASNNIGEFLAIVHALAYCKKNKIDTIIYSDSLIAIKWVKDKQPNSKVLKDKTNTKVFEILDRSIQWLQQNTFASKIEKWETKVWGENPADFGRK